MKFPHHRCDVVEFSGSSDKASSGVLDSQDSYRQTNGLTHRPCCMLCDQMANLKNLDLLYLLVEAADVGVRLLRCLLQLHHSHHWVSVVRQNTDHRVDLAYNEAS